MQLVMRVPFELGDQVVANAEALGVTRTDYLTALISYGMKHMPAEEQPQQAAAFELRNTG